MNLNSISVFLQNLSSSHFLLLNFVIAGFLILVFLLNKKNSRNPTKLNLFNSNQNVPINNNISINNENQKENITSKGRNTNYYYSSNQNNQTNQNNQKNNPFRDLNVEFVYKGNVHDVFQVLDLPAGSSLIKIKECFEQYQNSNKKDELKELAFKTIWEKFKN